MHDFLLWQTPQNRISIRTSCGPGSRRSNVNGASGAGDFVPVLRID